MSASIKRILAMFLGVAVMQSAASATLRHGYTDMRYGQLHYAIAKPAGAGPAAVPIVLLHQSPNSSREMDSLVAALGDRRVAIAIDTPGYGNSDGPAVAPSIEDYAGAIIEALHHLGYGADRPIDLFGYHTGSKIATEIALREPRLVRRLALSGIFIVAPDRLREAKAAIYNPPSYAALYERVCQGLPQLEAYYRKAGLPDAAWGRVLADSLGTGPRREFGHTAAFEYEPHFAARLGQLTQPVQLLVIDDGLAAETREAAKYLRKAVVTDQGFGGAAFVTQAGSVAAALEAFFAGKP